MMTAKVRIGLALFALPLCGALMAFRMTANAQQTIFNVPSADAAPRGAVFLEHESQFRPWNPWRFWLGTHYAALGVGLNTELGATLINVSAPASDNISLGLGFKTALPVFSKKFPKRELKLTVGELVPVSLQGKGVGSWSYAHASGRLPKLNTRLTAGVSAGTKLIFGRNTVHFIGGYEQPVTKNLSVIGDWYSGTHANGLFIPGFSYQLPRATTLYCGYQIPNNRRAGRSGFVIELAKFF